MAFRDPCDLPELPIVCLRPLWYACCSLSDRLQHAYRLCQDPLWSAWAPVVHPDPLWLPGLPWVPGLLWSARDPFFLPRPFFGLPGHLWSTWAILQPTLAPGVRAPCGTTCRSLLAPAGARVDVWLSVSRNLVHHSSEFRSFRRSL